MAVAQQCVQFTSAAPRHSRLGSKLDGGEILGKPEYRTSTRLSHARRSATCQSTSQQQQQRQRQRQQRKQARQQREETEGHDQRSPVARNRRDVMIGTGAAALSLAVGSAVVPAMPAAATPTFVIPPQGFRLVVDRFEGYAFYVPETWVEVKGSGQKCFYRDSIILDENLSVEISSPSSSRYVSVADLGEPREAGDRLLKTFLTEFMSTRLGVRRESTLVSTDARFSPDGEDLYYIVEVNVKSYANNNQLAIMPEERVAMLEWDRRYLTVLGVANRRLYQLRLQVPERLLVQERPKLRQIMNSFQVSEVLSL